MSKVFTGRFFEDFRIGQQLVHAVPRTLHGGDISSYFALTAFIFSLKARLRTSLAVPRYSATISVKR